MEQKKIDTQKMTQHMFPSQSTDVSIRSPDLHPVADLGGALFVHGEMGLCPGKIVLYGADGVSSRIVRCCRGLQMVVGVSGGSQAIAKGHNVLKSSGCGGLRRAGDGVQMMKGATRDSRENHV